MVAEGDPILNRVPDKLGPRSAHDSHANFVGALKECVTDTLLNLDELQLAVAGEQAERLFFTATISPKAELQAAGRLKPGLLGEGESFMIVGRKGNAGQMAIKLFAGHREPGFVCDNGMITGESLLMHKRQTLNLDLRAELLAGLQLFLGEAENLGQARLIARAAPITDQQAWAYSARLLHEKVITQAVFNEALKNYFQPDASMVDCHPRARLGLAGSFTRAFRPLSAPRKLAATQRVTEDLVVNPPEEWVGSTGPINMWRAN